MDKDINLRITVMTIIMAAFFGILNYIPKDKTYDSIQSEVFLKVASNVFLKIALPMFLLYLIIIALNLTYGRKREISEKIEGIIYNIAIVITALIVILASLFYIILWIVAPLSVGLAIILCWMSLIIIAVLAFFNFPRFIWDGWLISKFSIVKLIR